MTWTRKRTSRTSSEPGHPDYDPFVHAERLGLEVIYRPIRTENGRLYPEHNLIVLRSGMKARYDRSSLAHELSHFALGHVDHGVPKQEKQANKMAANSLIQLDRCAELVHAVDDCHQLGIELNVSTKLVLVFLNEHRLVLRAATTDSPSLWSDESDWSGSYSPWS